MTSPAHTPVRAVIFDLDGTLIDTAPEFITTVHILREENQLSRLPDLTIRKQVSNGARALVTLALGLAEGEPGFEDQRLRLLDIYQQQLGSAAQLFPGLQELLHTLGNGGLGWGICTNKPSYLTDQLLAAMAIEPAPASVVCPDHVSQPKPHPESLYLNCKHLDCQPREVIYVGDHLRDIQAGRNAGMRTIAAGWGYIEDGDDPGAWGADHIVANSQALADLLSQLAGD